MDTFPTTEIHLPSCQIRIALGSAGQGGAIFADADHVPDSMQRLVLAHACAGVDVAAPGYVRGLEAALEAHWNDCAD